MPHCHILPDSERVSVTPICETTPESVVDQMLGRELKKDLGSGRDAKPGEVVLRAARIKAPGV
jgi:ABC-type sugar transport system, ATPase component